MPAANEPKKKYLCSRCKKTMSEIKFYTHRDGTKDDMCKECLCAHVNNFEPSSFTWILKRMDVPYVPQEWNVLRDRKYNEDPRKGTGGPAVMGKYLAKMKLKQFVNPDTNELYSWDETDLLLERRYTKEEKTEEELEIEKEQIERLNQALEAGEISEAEYKTLVPTDEVKEVYEANPDMFPGWTVVSGDPFAGDNDYISEDALPDPAADLTDEDKVYLAMKWGRLYKPNEWVELEKKYTEMINSFDVQDADTRNTLILMCKTDLKMNQALDCGDIDGYQKLAKVSDSLRKSGKFTAAQNKDKDNDQIDCTGVLVAMCEREGGFIERYATDVPKDIIDKCIIDQNKYVYNLVTKDLGFGQQIENYLKKIQLERENMEKTDDDFEDDEEIEDEEIAKFYERVADEKEEDAHVTEKTNAYDKRGETNGASEFDGTLDE
jgi:hypothetical protein